MRRFELTKSVAAAMVCMLLWTPAIRGQHRNMNWMFRGHWISFVSGEPDLIAETPFATTSCSMSDPATGALRVYVAHNGATQLVSAVHQLLPTSPGFPTGNYIGSQESLFVPRPAHPDEAFFVTFRRVFTPPPHPTLYGFRRLFVGEGGDLPAVLDTGYTWFMDDACEKRMVVPHANGIDYWFVGQVIGTNTFQAYPITADGIAEQPVESQAGAVPIADEWAGQLCSTVQGDRFVNVSEQWQWTSDAQDASLIELFGLDAATGAIAHQFTFTDLGRVRGVEFSPSGRFLYVADWPVDAAPQTYVRRLFQYDLWAADIQGSRVLLDSVSGTNWALPSITALGLAPDGRIYMAREPFVPYLSVIEQPDLPAPACGFVQEGFNTGTPMNWLPHFMKRYHDDISLLVASPAAQGTPRIAPNPIDTHCEVLLPGTDGPCSFTWIDALGRTARMEQAVLVQGRATLDASCLSPGPYLLRSAFSDGRAPVIQRAWVQP